MRKDDKYYKVIDENWVHEYEYFAKHPHRSGKYHILINNATKEPERIYITYLKKMVKGRKKAFEILRQILLNKVEHLEEIIRNSPE